tara:strand:- start:2291 stop:3379 length:1089 start_codon:yes stop_codon:yes gene_type:complete
MNTSKLTNCRENEEVLFSDMQDDTARSKIGFSKVQACCKVAASQHYRYVWIDTCCIDKSSSAELSEAINSMFAYYSQSRVCYAYLDVQLPESNVTSEHLRSARWMYRGWTLQELIAPVHLQFFDKRWVPLGTRETLATPLSEVTQIDVSLLRRELILSDFSIARRMSWAANRETTRPEDIAYCLFGIFDVHLPPLYGEGSAKAFLRLQKEIVQDSTDMSVLAWSLADRPGEGIESYISAFARSPRWFSESGTVEVNEKKVEPFRITNKGLRITLPLIDETSKSRGDHAYCTAVLPNCTYLAEPAAHVGIHLYKSNREGNDDVWYRWGRRYADRRQRSVYAVNAESMQHARLTKIYISMRHGW